MKRIEGNNFCGAEKFDCSTFQETVFKDFFLEIKQPVTMRLFEKLHRDGHYWPVKKTRASQFLLSPR